MTIVSRDPRRFPLQFLALEPLARAALALLLALSLVVGVAAPRAALAAHGLALGGPPKYGPDFRAFEYVNPAAPKGGSVTMASMGTFDKLNPFTLKGVRAEGLSELVFETLTVMSLDEPMSAYALLARDMELAPDRLSITFRLDPRARFTNGDPVEAADVKHSFDTLRSKAASPMWRQYWADVKQAVVVDKSTIRFEFARRNRELHMIVGSVPVFSRKWGGGKPFDQVVQDTPIATGPYLIERVDLGKSITYRRDPNYWGADIPSRRGQFNFDRVHFTYFLDEFARIEAFKAGNFDFVQENVAKNWARSYYGRRFEDGTLVKTELENSNAQGMQAFVMNTRRPLFADVRVRRAVSLAMDFEWMNRQLFFNQYVRSYSFFTNTEMAARGLPSDAELALLEPFRAQLSPVVFSEVQPPPSTKPPSSLRENLREAKRLLGEAGWTYRDGALRNAAGQPFEFEILIAQRTFERVIAPFARNLEKLGIVARSRTMDSSLYKKRVDDYDFDMIVHWYLSSQSPGNELALRFTSQAADTPGSNNYMGVKSPAVDALVERILSVDSREELLTATRALDRVLLAGHYVVPHWFNRTWRVSYRNRFGRPQALPLYYSADDWFLMAWWSQPGGVPPAPPAAAQAPPGAPHSTAAN